MTARRRPDGGVVLVNVLVTLALAASVVHAMVSLSDLSIARSQRYSEAAQAQALIAAAEASLIAALARDAREAPGSDNLTEPWARIAQTPVRIEDGSFAMVIEDAQSRINLNSPMMRGQQGAQLLGRVGAALDLPADVAPRLAARLAQARPLDRLGDLGAEAGLDPAEIAALGRFLTVLPHGTDVNLNTAPAEVIAVLTDNPVQAAALVGARTRNGLLTQQDAANARVVLPPGAGFTSSWFRATITVQIGGTSQQVRSLIQRRAGPGGGLGGGLGGGRPRVAVVARETPFRPGPVAGDGAGP